MDPEEVLRIIFSDMPARYKLAEITAYAHQQAETVEMSDDSYETEPEEGSPEKPIDLTK